MLHPTKIPGGENGWYVVVFDNENFLVAKYVF